MNKAVCNVANTRILNEKINKMRVQTLFNIITGNIATCVFFAFYGKRQESH